MLSKTKIKDIQSLGQKKLRDSEGLFIAEGPKLVSELLSAKNTVVREVFGLEDWIASHQQFGKKTILTGITEAEMEKISQLNTPNQVLAIVEQYPAEVLKAEKGRITLALDEIQDPGNLGTIIRLADWFGIDHIICSHGTADRYNPKVVQATMGSIARIKMMYTDLEEWLWEQEGIPVIAAVLEGENITEIKKPKEGILLIGNESKGIHAALQKLSNIRITIPKKGEAESLNAAVATGIILSHLT